VRGLFTRAIRPPDDIVPNPNDPASVPPSTVGPDQLVRPGDPAGVQILDAGPATTGPPPTIMPSAWSGWPAEWWPPLWQGHLAQLTDTAWACIDLNASVLAAMPPFLVNAAPTVDAGWLTNPDPDVYTSWEEFAKTLFWDYQAAGEVFVLATAFYATGWPARFHVLPGWTVEVELGEDGLRRYLIGRQEVPREQLLHIRYHSSVGDARGHGPLEAGAGRLVAAQVLSRYASNIAANGGVPASILKHPEQQSPEQALALQQQWVTARQNSLGLPAVLSGGIEWEPVALDPEKMSLVELSKWNESRIAILLGVPPFLMGLPSGGDSLTYSTTVQLFDYHWRAGLRPKAQAVMSALSGWALPRGTSVEVNRDAYVEPEPLQRAQTAQILAGIVDPQTGRQALTVDEIRAAERLDQASEPLNQGVLQ
jgi:HK97 family phage portal protein